MKKDWNNLACNKCGLINDYTVTVKSNQNVCNCNGCNNFLGNKPKDPSEVNLRDYKMPFGKYKGEYIIEIDDNQYLQWALETTKVSGNIKRSIEFRLKFGGLSHE